KDGRLFCIYTQRGSWQLACVDPQTRRLESLDVPFTEFAGGATLRLAGESLVFVGGSPTEPMSVVRLNLETRKAEMLRRSTDLTIDSGFLSPPQPIEFPTEQGRTAHALYYPPRNKDFAPPPGAHPPLLPPS